MVARSRKVNTGQLKSPLKSYSALYNREGSSPVEHNEISKI